MPGVQRGFLAMCEKGLLSGHKLAGLKFRLIDGDNHVVDSSEHAFYLAAYFAVKECFEKGVWQLLEPIMMVEINGPEEFQVNSTKFGFCKFIFEYSKSKMFLGNCYGSIESEERYNHGN